MAYRPPRLFRRRSRLIALIALLSVLPAVPLLAAPTAAQSAIGNPQSAIAQPAGLTMRVRAAYDGHYKVGEWFPVQVDLSNDGTGSVAGQVQVVAKDANGGDVTTYVRDVELPSPSRKQVTLSTFAATYARSFEVKLVSGSNVLLSQTVSVDPVEYPAFLLGVVSSDPGLLNVLNGERIGTLGTTVGFASPNGSPTGGATASRVTVAHLQAGDLPTSAATLAGLDALILAGTDTSNLPAEVHSALESWVLRGGTLVVAGGDPTAAGLSDLLPVQVNGTRQATDFSALSTYSGVAASLQSTGPVLVAAARALPERGGQVLAADGTGVVLATRSYGSGAILFLALDPALPPLQSWTGTLSLWQRALGGTNVELSAVAQRRMNSYSGFGYGYSGYGNPLSAGIELPSPWIVGGFLLAYVLLVGPINYLVLRARKQVELSWVTIPVFIAIFVVGAYILGVTTRGSDTRLIQSSVVHVYGNAPQATVDSFIGVLSPLRGTYSLSFTGDLPLTELDPSAQGLPHGNPALIVQGRPTTVRNLPLDTWALRGFVGESTLAYADPFSATLRLENGRIVGEILNQSNAILREVGVIYGSGATLVGDLAPGARHSVSLALSSGYGNRSVLDQLLPGAGMGYDAPRALQRRIGLVNSLLPTLVSGGNQGVVLADVVAWSDAAPLDLRLPGQQVRSEATTLVAGTAPISLPAGGWSLPRYLSNWQVVSGDTSPGYGYGGGQLTLRLDTNPAVFQFVLPPGFQPSTLAIGCDLTAGSYNGFFSVQPALYNWTTGQFDPMQQNGQQVTISPSGSSSLASALLALPSPLTPYVGPRGEVVLQFSGQGSFSEVQVEDLFIEGTGQ